MAKKSKRQKTKRYESILPARPAPPTTTLPGSKQKQAILSERFDKRQSLHHGDDEQDTHKQWLCMAAFVTRVQRFPATEQGDKEGEKHIEDVRRMLMRGNPNDPKPDTPEKYSEKSSEVPHNKTSSPTPGYRIRQARLDRKISMRKLSRLSGIPHSALAAVERLIVAPCLWTLFRVAKALQININWLACLERREDGTIIVLCS